MPRPSPKTESQPWKRGRGDSHRTRNTLEPAAKPDSVPSVREGGSHLSGARVTAHLDAAYPELKGNGPLPAPEGGLTPAWPCSRWGLPGRDGHPPRRWSLTPPFHPYLAPLREADLAVFARRSSRLFARRYPLCGTLPSGHPAWPLASTVPCGVRTFLVAPGISSRVQRGCQAGSSVN
jgi:hypothetical protein